MFDDLRSDDDLSGLEGHQPKPIRRSDRQRQLADREVPLGHQEEENRVLAPAVHDWLDGHLPEASVRKGATAHDVAFWKSINSEVDRHRRTRTPVYLEAQIMNALPQTPPGLITPFWRREFVVTPTTAVVAAAALLGFGAAVTAAIMAVAL